MIHPSRAKVGIVGLGFVGKAVESSFDMAETVCLDSDPRKGYTGTYADLMTCEAIFVCVPSPMNTDGTCDTSILEEVLLKLKGFTGVIISKVTAPPDTYQHLNSIYPNLIHSPEFLTAANAFRDYINATTAVVGGNIKAYRTEAAQFIKASQPMANIVECGIGEAALTKYAINSFLATKVVFMNEVYQLADTLGLDYNMITAIMRTDKRIGSSHMTVPGQDGSLGFGGYCFPKDTEALSKFAESKRSSLSVLDAAIKKNTMLRLTSPK
jgi:UDPglucose 6-dehydrogenase